jgi:hypothetical protein
MLVFGLSLFYCKPYATRGGVGEVCTLTLEAAPPPCAVQRPGASSHSTACPPIPPRPLLPHTWQVLLTFPSAHGPLRVARLGPLLSSLSQSYPCSQRERASGSWRVLRLPARRGLRPYQPGLEAGVRPGHGGLVLGGRHVA